MMGPQTYRELGAVALANGFPVPERTGAIFSSYKVPGRRAQGMLDYLRRVQREREATPVRVAREPRPRRTVPTQSVVYFLRGGDLIKIGTSVRLAHRLSGLRCGSPTPIVLMHSMPGDRQTEQHLHHLSPDPLLSRGFVACPPPHRRNCGGVVSASAYRSGWARVFQCGFRFTSECGAYESNRCSLRREHAGDHFPDPDDTGRLKGMYSFECGPPALSTRLDLPTPTLPERT